MNGCGEVLTAQNGSERVQGAGNEREIDPHAPLVPCEQAGVDKHLEVVRAGRLGESQRFGQVTHARLTAFVSGDEGQQTQPRRVRDRLQDVRQPQGRFGVQRFPHQRLVAAGVVNALDPEAVTVGGLGPLMQDWPATGSDWPTGWV